MKKNIIALILLSPLMISPLCAQTEHENNAVKAYPSMEAALDHIEKYKKALKKSQAENSSLAADIGKELIKILELADEKASLENLERIIDAKKSMLKLTHQSIRVQKDMIKIQNHLLNKIDLTLDQDSTKINEVMIKGLHDLRKKFAEDLKVLEKNLSAALINEDELERDIQKVQKQLETLQ